ncbi:ABC transporter permease [Agrobacterium vitis]|uniref:ABC transporter permease n=1 Tax=Agrobacterium vitis TaxID=373 RepID=UPI0012E82949|nr:ABC transporter permease [Agrobacterium vitis]MVA23858.1 ABC transporter permease subunit [Agrobacterium vitis]
MSDTLTDPVDDKEIVPEAISPSRRLLRDFARSRLALFGLVLLCIVCFGALFAPWLTPQNPYDLMQLDIMDGTQPPGTESMSGGFTFLLGSDDQGRDMLSAILYGLRISLFVGIISAVAAALIGATLGMTAAYVGGRVEASIMRLVDLQLSFPTILVALMILAFLGKGVTNVVLALVIVEWATFARAARGTALVETRREYIEAAECMGLSLRRILLKHLLPNCIPPLIVIVTIQIARAISLEATLSFLGVGVPITEPSLGLLISNGYQYMFAGRYWMSVFPGIALLITIVAINLVGDQLRDILNPRNRM